VVEPPTENLNPLPRQKMLDRFYPPPKYYYFNPPTSMGESNSEKEIRENEEHSACIMESINLLQFNINE
jgi:hypothetical protein